MVICTHLVLRERSVNTGPHRRRVQVLMPSILQGTPSNSSDIAEPMNIDGAVRVGHQCTSDSNSV